MINKTQRKKLKRHLGASYAADVQEILQKDNKTTNRGTDYSINYIHRVFTGDRNNIDVEAAIYKLYSKRKLQHEKNVELQKQILT